MRELGEGQKRLGRRAGRLGLEEAHELCLGQERRADVEVRAEALPRRQVHHGGASARLRLIGSHRRQRWLIVRRGADTLRHERGALAAERLPKGRGLGLGLRGREAHRAAVVREDSLEHRSAREQFLLADRAAVRAVGRRRTVRAGATGRPARREGQHVLEQQPNQRVLRAVAAPSCGALVGEVGERCEEQAVRERLLGAWRTTSDARGALPAGD